jgi:hypothetical protein
LDYNNAVENEIPETEGAAQLGSKVGFCRCQSSQLVSTIRIQTRLLRKPRVEDLSHERGVAAAVERWLTCRIALGVHRRDRGCQFQERREIAANPRRGGNEGEPRRRLPYPQPLVVSEEEGAVLDDRTT